jgi:GH25 family lysozyme M1 (1,4-beta-N-acetylmuramidase)
VDPLHQTDVEWLTVVGFNGGAAIVRALYGASHVDKLWAQGRRAAAHEAGIKVLGIYQYLVQTEDALAQAEAFVREVGALQHGEFAVLDLEEGAGDQCERAKTWFEYVDAHLSYPGYAGAWLYSDKAFLDAHLSAFVTESKRHLWIADYGVQPSDRHSLWQHTDGTIAVPHDWHEHWPGVGVCDCSIFAGSLEQLHALTCGAGVASGA